MVPGRGRARARSRALPPVLAVLVLVTSACAGTAGGAARHRSGTGRYARSAGASTDPCGTRAAPPARYQHVIWIWMENHTVHQVIGSAHAPYETALARDCGSAARYATVGRPSLPNYIGATSGDVHGITDDAPPPDHPLVSDNLFRQVRAAGLSEQSFEESMARRCETGDNPGYIPSHNPALYYVGGADRTACAADDVSLGIVHHGRLHDALRFDRLPAFSFVTPNICSDTHNCRVRAGDRWLAQWVRAIVSSRAYRSGTTAVFLVWDEPTPMPLLVIAPSVAPGTVARVPLDHYSLLRTTEEMLGLPLLGHAATATDLRAVFRV